MKSAARGKAARKKKALRARRRQRRVHGSPSAGTLVSFERRGLGARSGGQSGDTQGLSAAPDFDSESVEELIQEGQSFEAEVLDGIEQAADPDEAEVTTHEVPEDDVPEEYTEKS
ncbi:MAG TPA: hypothetical protein VED66_00945 [Candidatus Sulfotelmatobacter sp.]|nr:hypothetical protein [Candidatus Sulfotelmatobacter sp.]